MNLADELIDQAERLAALDPGEPKQASLRRAVSAAYYGLFHMLAAEAAACMIPDTAPRLAAHFQRSLDHAAMRRTCQAFVAHGGAGPLLDLLAGPLEAEIRRLAQSFVVLQQARQAADYDVLHTLTREETLSVVDDLRDAIAGWRRMEGHPNRVVFLVALATPRLISGR